jgi:GNAT superfamily N-acetyltransferase
MEIQLTLSNSFPDMVIRLMVEDDVSHADLEMNVDNIARYYKMQIQGRLFAFVAVQNTRILGYVTLPLVSNDLTFSSRAIPEIIDLRVFPPYQNKGIGTALIKACEDKGRELGWPMIGIGVEMKPEYAAAQHLYPKLGYIPIEKVSQTDVWALYKPLDDVDPGISSE